MEFKLQLSRMVTEERDKKKFEELGFKFELFDRFQWPYNIDMKKCRYVSVNTPSINFESFEDLKNFIKKWGDIIVRNDETIEVL